MTWFLEKNRWDEGRSALAQGLVSTRYHQPQTVGEGEAGGVGGGAGRGEGNDKKLIFLFARQGSSPFVCCGTVRVIEVELATTRSSLVKITFEVTDYDGGGEHDDRSAQAREKTDLALVPDATGPALGLAPGLAPVCLRDAPLYTDLVAVHKDEMDVLFGAYSRASVEEKRLLDAAAAATAAAAAAATAGGGVGGEGGDSVLLEQHHN